MDRPTTLVEALARSKGLETGLVENRYAELADLSPQTSLLSRLEAERVYTLADCPEIWGKIQQYEKAHPQVTEYALWRSPWLFALILGCFGTEWALRKRFGLA